ncbi:MAG: hypothetical protein FWG64_05630 [Firmicutes bacterium]|nr:hypothetical protein [Bacillota bacterium]
MPAEGNRLVIHWQNRTNADVSPDEGITIGASRPGTGNFTSGNEISRTYAQLNATHGAYARILELNPQNLVVRFGWVWIMRGSVPVQIQPTFLKFAERADNIP